MGAAHGKLCQPDFLSISASVLYKQYIEGLLIWPIVESLKFVHDMIRIWFIVMGRQVVNPAAKGLTGVKEGIEPVCVATSRGGADQNL